MTDRIEELCEMSDLMIGCIPAVGFQCLTVQEIPTIGRNVPSKLMRNGKNDTRGDEFIDAIRRQVAIHKGRR